jgi:hypothetical protein
MNCSGCNIYYDNFDDLSNHQLYCITYIYNNKNTKPINHELLINIIDIISLLKLNKLKINTIIPKEQLLLNITRENQIRKKIHTLNNAYDQYNIVKYIYNFIDNNNKQYYLLNDLLNLISELYHLDKNNVYNILIIYSNIRQKFIL